MAIIARGNRDRIINYFCLKVPVKQGSNKHRKPECINSTLLLHLLKPRNETQKYKKTVSFSPENCKRLPQLDSGEFFLGKNYLQTVYLVAKAV